ncbi:Uncharacterised protein [Mycobacteroides abscessus subsp. abscessus]|nr:hypothetical protein MAUC22_00205 [Mycobacteroides abscessus UC22]OTR16502.1 hypothetical protein B9M80_26345 [Mycobacteroides abscessus]RWU55991.1 hypothetical protein EPJ93_20535 [Mycobacteroides abscessus subsp. abscessus]SKX48488.1 Uncharacterised protein [Mycobacteroides abscessus subsp. abscessus]
MAPVHAARMMYPRGRDHKPGRSRRVSTADTAVLTDPTLGIKVMAENLGRSVGSVYDATPLHPRSHPQHGTSTGWQYGCKRTPCQQYNRDRIAMPPLFRSGREFRSPEPRVDPRNATGKRTKRKRSGTLSSS